LEVDVEGDVDLNKVTDMELKLAKQKMDEKFLQNRVLPGDPGFEYDRQVMVTGMCVMPRS
jgi:centrosomal protein CEP19